MASNFPTSLDTFTNPSSTDAMDSVSVPHATQHSDLNDAVEALEAKVGANGSAVTSSHDYKIAQLEAISHGKILQVVSTTKTDTFSTTESAYGSEVDITGLSATITPTSTSSKILVMFSVNASQDTPASAGIAGVLLRDSTRIFVGTSGTQFTSNYLRYADVADNMVMFSAQYLDSPSTTSSVTYKYAIRSVSSGTVYVNRRASGTTTGLASSITVMEVSA